MNPIVTVNVTQQIAPPPDLLQKTGAIISQGGTTLGVGNYSLLTQESDLTALLAAALTITSLSWGSTNGGRVIVTTTAAHGIPINSQFVTTIAGAVPAAYNGTYLCRVTGTSTFVYYLASDPGSATTPGTYTPNNVGELQAMASTFFAQGAQQGVYVLELGAGAVSVGVSALSDFIDNNDQVFYAYLVPRFWDGDSSFLSLIAELEATTSKTYFFVTTALQTYSAYTELMKCVVAMIENPVYRAWATNTLSAASWSGGVVTATTTAAHGVLPGDTFVLTGVVPTAYNGTYIALTGTTGSTLVYALATNPTAYVSGGTLQPRYYASTGIPVTEFSHAADFQRALNYNPSNTNKVTPFGFGTLVGVTAFSARGNRSLLATLEAANINVVGNGNEGGISNNLLFYGRTLDSRVFNYWYSVDWVQINAARAIANAIFNGSNDPINPLYYNQVGIERLQQAVAQVGQSAVTFGLAVGSVIITNLDEAAFAYNLNRGIYNGNVVINAIPFTSYASANPGDYRIGKYAGLSMAYTPQIGFQSIIFNIVATDFVAA
jgi:hypothetical protein